MTEPIPVELVGCPCAYNRTYTLNETGLTEDDLKELRRYSALLDDDNYSYPEFRCSECGLNVCSDECSICDAKPTKEGFRP